MTWVLAPILRWDRYFQQWLHCYVKVLAPSWTVEIWYVGYRARCDHNSPVVPGHGNTPGYSHVLDIDRHHIEELVCKGCRILSSFIDRACVYDEATMLDEARVGWKGKLCLHNASEHCIRPSPTNTHHGFIPSRDITTAIPMAILRYARLHNVMARTCSDDEDMLSHRTRYKMVCCRTA